VVVGAVRRLLLSALEFVTGDRYVRVALLRESAGSSPWTIDTIDAAIQHARARERQRPVDVHL
jgi:hypothetical protein